jgi:hypothetical protein
MAYGAEIWTWNKKHKDIKAAERIKKHIYRGMTQTRTLLLLLLLIIIIKIKGHSGTEYAMHK